MKMFALAALVGGAAAGATEFDASQSIVSARFGPSSGRYPAALQVRIPIPHLEKAVDIDLEVNDMLFSPNWYAETWGPDGTLVHNETNVDDFQCHYVGSVTGFEADSIATLSVCDGIGVRGEIYMPGAHVEIRPADDAAGEPSIRELGAHIVYNITERLDLAWGHVQRPPPAPAENWAAAGNDPATSNTYMNDVVVATDRARLVRLGSQNELLNTQSIMNTAQQAYSDSRSSWRSDRPNHRIRSQHQDPSQWNSQQCLSSNDSRYLDFCRDYFVAQHRGADNIQCIQEGCPASVLGWGWVDTMCGTYSVGWNLGLANDDHCTAVTVAHEMGHNYGFDHEPGRTVMGTGRDNFFGPDAINRWQQTQGRYACLR